MAEWKHYEVKCPCGNVVGTIGAYKGTKSSGTKHCTQCKNTIEWKFDGSIVRTTYKR